jgi:hypothetical protein
MEICQWCMALVVTRWQGTMGCLSHVCLHLVLAGKEGGSSNEHSRRTYWNGWPGLVVCACDCNSSSLLMFLGPILGSSRQPGRAEMESCSYMEEMETFVIGITATTQSTYMSSELHAIIHVSVRLSFVSSDLAAPSLPIPPRSCPHATTRVHVSRPALESCSSRTQHTSASSTFFYLTNFDLHAS